MNTHSQGRRLFRLDNAANVYPAVRSRKRPGVFRVSATLDQPINPVAMQQALDKTLKRIPSFSVKMRAGLFWHYFIHSEQIIYVEPDVINPCLHFSEAENSGFLLRVRYHNRIIALELFHAISDGSGAIIFLKTLIAQYLKLHGIHIPPEHGVLDCEKKPLPEELEDAFPSFAGQKKMQGCQQKRTFQITGTPLQPFDLRIITGEIPIERTKEKASFFGVSITEYLVAVFIYSLDLFQHSLHPHRLLPVTVQVPVNLRQYQSPKTLRNFSSYVCPGIDPGKGTYAFDEIVDLVHHYLQLNVTEKKLRSRVAVNVRNEKNRLVRIIPLFLKNQVIHIGYKLTGPVSFTSTASNLGLIKIPQEMVPFVENFDIVLGPSPETSVKCALIGYQDKIRINFTSTITEALIEQTFFTFLVNEGISVKISANQESSNGILC